MGITGERVRTRAALGVERPLVYGVALVLILLPSLLLAPDQGGVTGSFRPGYDFAAYYRAGRAVLDGMSPYLPETVSGPFALNIMYGYFYPPPFAAAIIPLALLPPLVANAVWIALLSGALLLAGAIIAGAGDPRRAETPTAVVIGLALGLSTPGFSGIAVGNVSPLLGALVLAPMVAAHRERLAGVAVALGALTKIEPALWGAFLLGTGRVRALLVAAGTGLAVVIVTFALPGVRAGWADYPRVLTNAAASDRVADGYLGGNLSAASLLGLRPESAHILEFGLLAGAVVLMLLAGRFGARFAPAAASVAMFSTPSMWLHSCLLVVPAALTVVALGPGLSLRRGAIHLSGVRLAELAAVVFFCVSYLLLILGIDRIAAFVLVIPLVLGAIAAGPRGRTA